VPTRRSADRLAITIEPSTPSTPVAGTPGQNHVSVRPGSGGAEGIHPTAAVLYTARSAESCVRDTKIVDPDDLSVLAKGRTDSLTLITCYPFAYIGHAPQRFIVRAERVGVPAQPGLQTRPAAAVQAATAPTPVRPRATKPKPAKPAKASARSAPRQTLTRDTVSRQTRKGVSASRPAERKVDPPKKRKWYRLLF